MRLRVAALAAGAALVAPALVFAGSGPPAPALSGADPVTGKRVSLAAYRGQPVVINVWASWCGGCRQEAADLTSFARSHPKLAIVGVDTQDSVEGAKAFYSVYDQNWPSIFDPSGAAAARLGSLGIPTTIFLDRQHRIIVRIQGATTLAQLNKALRVVTRR
jgi:thiol-disulfide isomerase/thioredoxin